MGAYLQVKERQANSNKGLDWGLELEGLDWVGDRGFDWKLKLD
jgi:hypothetical protein